MEEENGTKPVRGIDPYAPTVYYQEPRTQPAPNIAYELIPIPPPPPKEPVTVRLSHVIIVVGIFALVVSLASTLLITYAIRAGFTHQPIVTPNTSPNRLVTQITQAKPTPTLPTPTQTSTSASIPPTPTPKPPPVYNGPTAYELYTAFKSDPSVSMLPSSQGGGPYNIPTKQWIQCCGFYPGHGGYALEDEYRAGYTTTFCIAVFNTAADATLITNQISNGGAYPADCDYGYSPPLFAIQTGQCVLIYIPSLTYSNINGYVSDMQNYCGA